jgi:hypothetical protein
LSGVALNPPMDVFTFFFNQRSNGDYSVTHGVVGTAACESRPRCARSTGPRRS